MYSLTPLNPEICGLQKCNKFGKQFDRIIIWAGSSFVIVAGTEEAFAGVQQWFFLAKVEAHLQVTVLLWATLLVRMVFCPVIISFICQISFMYTQLMVVFPYLWTY